MYVQKCPSSNRSYLFTFRQYPPHRLFSNAELQKNHTIVTRTVSSIGKLMTFGNAFHRCNISGVGSVHFQILINILVSDVVYWGVALFLLLLKNQVLTVF